MAKSRFSFENSKSLTFDTVLKPTATADFFLCNSLEEKKKYIYFKRGAFGTSNFQCGNQNTKIPKDGLQWHKTAEICDSGAEVWRVESM